MRVHLRRGQLPMVVAVAALTACSASHASRLLSSPGAGGSMRGSFSETSARGAGASESAASGAAAAGAGTVAGAAPAPAAADAMSGGSKAIEPGANVRTGLRAGSVDDNARFADYLAYRQAFAAEGVHAKDLDVSERHVFTVTSPAGDPVVGADIVVLDDAQKKIRELRTYSDGRALWFPRADGVGEANHFTALVSKDGVTKTVDVDRSQLQHPVVLDVKAPPQRPQLDLEFLVDATGSMGDEIAQLKSSLTDIAARIDALPSRPDVRFALTIYRDHGDSFLTRTWNFTSDVAAFQHQIADVNADGGGDTPEDVQQGLHDALTKPSWRDPGTVKLLFLIGDAPPHLDYPDDPDYIADLQAAARDGIKIESLAASGLDDMGEYVWRQLAQATLGDFLFLTYGADDTTTHHVSGYAANNLDDVVVRLVDAELTANASASGNQQPAG